MTEIAAPGFSNSRELPVGLCGDGSGPYSHAILSEVDRGGAQEYRLNAVQDGEVVEVGRAPGLRIVGEGLLAFMLEERQEGTSLADVLPHATMVKGRAVFLLGEQTD